MFQIIIVSDSFNHFEKPISEYIKRLGKDIKIIKIKPEKNGEISTIIRKETEKIKEVLEKEKGFIIGLDFLGDELSTEAFNEFANKTIQRQSKLTFVIGGSYGYDKELMEPILHKKLSLSKMTFPHSMAFLMLIEQIYRIKSIEKNTGYHH
ncbi:MAG: 23S rRNA (pseudouridine(1915)-N(3))-methyltransferase RlmH [Candidatus Gracilibacteria bacterium]|nr:23S rRNA (pseudouridine(1915)-N(3))-methyltransferase RlmH [Candidatus Gracilibacteria bacterium]MDD2909037.1 23S rRNA (pseudouridine(1915)-N(3))-methyltransferase RlmH [Candidatus Gracilibacteria bacterium]